MRDYLKEWSSYWVIIHFIDNMLIIPTDSEWSPWSGCRFDSNKLSFFYSDGWADVLFNSSCLCSMGFTIWISYYSKKCLLEEVSHTNIIWSLYICCYSGRNKLVLMFHQTLFFAWFLKEVQWWLIKLCYAHRFFIDIYVVELYVRKF